MRGGDGAGLRAYNERLIIGAIRQGGPLSKADLARATGLSAQAASVIVNKLLDEGVLAKRPKLRGQVGQPQTPIALNPRGAYSAGVKIGRLSVEAVLIDFTGAIVAQRKADHDAPIAKPALEAAAKALDAVLSEAPRDRVAGVGVAMPGHLHQWAEEMGLPDGALDDWRETDAAAALSEATGHPATLCNDATAACAAELAAGGGLPGSAGLYVYLGAFIGGGLVIDGRLHRGGRDNAAALGSMPVCAPRDGRPEGPPAQLIHAASPLFLERRIVAAGGERGALLAETGRSEAAETAFAAWRPAAAEAIARAIVSTACVVDVETVVIDGILNRGWMAALASDVRNAVDGCNLAGLAPFELALGELGAQARVLGAALLPLQARYAAHPDLVLRGWTRRPPESAAADPSAVQ